MIAEIRIKNLLSFRDETVFSFEADSTKSMETYHVVEVAPDVRLLKLAVIYGANASGKSNFIQVYEFLRAFLTHTPINRNMPTGVIPFLMDARSDMNPSEISIVFYTPVGNGQPLTRFVYTLVADRTCVFKENIVYYTSQQPSTLFERTLDKGVSTIKFGGKIKLSAAAKEEISLRCLPNMSVCAAYLQVNVLIPEMAIVTDYFMKKMMQAVVPSVSLDKVAEKQLADKATKDYILRYLQEADFNIADISTQQDEKSPETVFKHNVTDAEGDTAYYDFPKRYESRGTVRTMGLSACVGKAVTSDAFLAVDEVESSLHPRLIEYIIERFLKESSQAQLLLTTHYDGLLAEDDLLRKDNIWFTEKNTDGATALYPLTDFKGLNRISSLQKAYKFGKFGAVPNI